MRTTAARLTRLVLTAAACTLPVVAGAAAGTAPGSPVGLRVLRFVDHSRVARFRDGSVRPRTLVTYVRYPRAGRPPFPLVVFGHGYALTPGIYARLLDAWARAGYVVAAPLFPLESPNAPGGPDESDLVNQPADVSLVISRLLAVTADARSPLHGLIDPTRIAVAGHSDGAETALAAAYDPRVRDPRVRAAIVLSGAALPGMGPFPRRGPPLLAAQGTADTINAPATTAAYFRAARRPKFLLWLLGASHLPPYTDQEAQLGVVERATIAFLDHYLKGRSLRALRLGARRPGVARLTADP